MKIEAYKLNTETNTLKETFAEKCDCAISQHYSGAAFPVCSEGKLHLATYEPEIGGLFLQREIEHTEVLKLAAKEAEAIYHDAFVEAGKNAIKILLETYEALKKYPE